ncbi:glycosyltransferase [Flavobacterium sp. SUN052]|uniref:glycosyltransferase n=1 Tax=Flavobacterium sp. SUN052 TaxID=3002441 RepID=UPI00237DB0B8|nr:glycosyltransferase [Flavobacterium sp. SUN052]MEC4005490.1 glycosyltransferase [Flavobacterium sp. SUN052]
MKIIRLTTLLDFGGIESKMANLSSVSDDNEWIFCSLGRGGTAENQITQNNKKVVCFNYDYKIPSLITIIKLFFYFKKNKPQVCHSAGSEANFHGVIAAKLARVPMVISEEIGIPSHSKLARFIFNFVYKLSDFVVGESQNVVDNLKSNYSINPEKLKVISNFALFKNYSTFNFENKSDVFKIVSVSRLEYVKNIEGIIKVIDKFNSQKIKIKYTIVGDGALSNELKELVNQLNLQNCIEFVGFQQETQKYYLSSDLFVLNSFSEGFSNSLLEAMYYKKMCITTNVGASLEMIQNDKNGWIIPVNDEHELYEKIKNCMQLNSETRENIEDNAQKTVIENYSLQNHVEKLIQLYNAKND